MSHYLVDLSLVYYFNNKVFYALEQIMTPRTKKQYLDIREEKREIIINSALKVFSERGYHASSIAEIAKEAKISKGLMYNYFESKESLLISILQEFIKMVSNFINPNQDDEITAEEMESFFDSMIDSMKTNREHWIILFQLAMQKDVVSLIFSQQGTGGASEKILRLAYQYFADRFENPYEELLFFRSVIKGFALILIFTPEMCPDEVVESFKLRLKNMFIKPKKK